MARQPSTQWIHETIVEKEFYCPDNLVTSAKISIPWVVCLNEWVCAFQIIGENDDYVYHAHGEDGLQTILIACAAIRTRFDKMNSMRSAKPAYETIFPKAIPWELGLDFHRSLCDIISDKVDYYENQILNRQ